MEIVIGNALEARDNGIIFTVPWVIPPDDNLLTDVRKCSKTYWEKIYV